jgi:nitrogen regulatory protein P-II 1
VLKEDRQKKRRDIMKLIEAIIKPVKLDEVKSALQKIGIEEYMESALICHGRQKGQAMLNRGVEHVANFVEKVKLEILAADDSVGKIVEVIGNIAKTERMEDCRIFILPFVEGC